MLNKLKSKIKNKLRKEKWLYRQYKKRLQAESALKIIESEKGEINPKFKKLSEEYAQDILGWTGFAPWLKVYSAVAGEFKEGWIPFNYFEEVVEPYTPLYFSYEKTLSSTLLKTDRFPDIAYYAGETFFTPSWEVIPPEDVEKYIFNLSDKVVFKQNNSGMGKGIYTCTRETFDIKKIQEKGNGVFQKYIRQHRFFQEIMPNSVSTLRLISAIDNCGKISCRSAYLKMGREDDLYVSPLSAINVAVDLLSGELQKKGYYRNWSSVDHHPDTNIVFKGKVIPKFNECIACVVKTHSAIPYCRVVGWDLTVDNNEEIQIIEWEKPGIRFAEAVQGPGFKDMGWEKLRPARIFDMLTKK